MPGGRPRKTLEAQKGNLTVKQQLDKKQAEEVLKIEKSHLEKLPACLINSVAKKEYKRIVGLLKGIDIICDLDINNIAGYANAYAQYFKATQELENEQLVDKDEAKANPLCQIQKMYAEEMRKFGGLIGLDINSRLKISSAKIDEINNKIDNEFGEI